MAVGLIFAGKSVGRHFDTVKLCSLIKMYNVIQLLHIGVGDLK